MVYDFNSLTKQADEANNRDKFYTDFSDVDPNKLHQITELTDWMRTKAKGSDVREIIAQLFERTWLEESKEGNANMEVAKARGRFPVLNDRLNNADMERAENARKLAQKANKDEVTNVMTPKGTLAYASLPTSGNQVGWYYYCPDGDGTNGAGNYVWNGTSWYFGGTGDEGYNLLKKDLINVDKALISGYNVFAKLLDNYYFNVDVGYNTKYDNWSVTELIPIIDYKKIYINISNDTRYNGFFDGSKKFIKGFQLYAGNNTIDIPSDAKYFCVSAETETMKQAKYWNEKSAVYLKDNKVSIDNIIGGVLDIQYDYLNNTRQLQLKAGYDRVLAYYKKAPNTIPLFVSTDNHMNPNPQTPQKYINNIDNDGMEINNINLGDSFVDNYTDEQAEGVIKITQYIKNYIGVTGNHDIQNATDVSQYYLRRAFGTTNLHREVIKTNYRNCYVTFDDLRRVKFIVIDPYELDSQTSVKYDVKIDTNTANWLLEELSNDSERDIVILMHQPLTSRNIHRDGTLQTWTESEEYLSKMDKVFKVLKDRKNKRSGIYIDDDGVSHNYNFSNTKSDLLCIINGHSHEELYLIEDGLTTYVCDWEGFTGNKSNTYILIDRDLKKMIIYKIGPASLYERLDLNI